MGVLQKLMQEQHTSFWLAFVQKMGDTRDIDAVPHQFCRHLKGAGRRIAITERTGVSGNRDEQGFGDFKIQWVSLLLDQLEYNLTCCGGGQVQIVKISVTGFARVMFDIDPTVRVLDPL